MLKIKKDKDKIVIEIPAEFLIEQYEQLESVGKEKMLDAFTKSLKLECPYSGLTAVHRMLELVCDVACSMGYFDEPDPAIAQPKGA